VARLAADDVAGAPVGDAALARRACDELAAADGAGEGEDPAAWAAAATEVAALEAETAVLRAALGRLEAAAAQRAADAAAAAAARAASWAAERERLGARNATLTAFLEGAPQRAQDIAREVGGLVQETLRRPEGRERGEGEAKA
jgi:hypothetical protein